MDSAEWVRWLANVTVGLQVTNYSQLSHYNPQRAKKVVCDSPGLVDFAIGLVIFVPFFPDRQVLFIEEIQITEGL